MQSRSVERDGMEGLLHGVPGNGQPLPRDAVPAEEASHRRFLLAEEKATLAPGYLVLASTEHRTKVLCPILGENLWRGQREHPPAGSGATPEPPEA